MVRWGYGDEVRFQVCCDGGGKEASQGVGICAVECSRAEEEVAHVHEETI